MAVKALSDWQRGKKRTEMVQNLKVATGAGRARVCPVYRSRAKQSHTRVGDRVFSVF